MTYKLQFICVYDISELAQGTGLLANSVAMLGSSEENMTLARVLAQLAEVEEHCDSVHVDQSDSDFFIFAELVHEYVGLVHAVKVGADSCN